MIVAARMMTLIVLALGLVDLLSAQEPKPGSDLPEFRAAFESGQGEPAIAIAFVQDGEPLVLCAGNDASGERITPRTLVPLLGLAKLLAADALHVKHKGKLDLGSGVKFGGRELSVLELLKGTPLLPDYAVLDGSPGDVSAAVLQACGEFAASGKCALRPTPLGAAEFVLLEPFVFGAQGRDWPSLLRATLAPHVPGLDPVRADQATAAQQPRLMLSAANLPVVAGAQPVLLRTLIAARDLASWWQWRVLSDLPPWTGPRMGSSRTAPAVATQQKWSFATALPSRSMPSCIPASGPASCGSDRQ